MLLSSGVYIAIMAAPTASIRPPTDATILTPAPVKGTVELGIMAPVADGAAVAVAAWTWPSEICLTDGKGAALPVAAVELAATGELALVTIGPGAVLTTGAELGAAAALVAFADPAVATQAQTALADAWTARPV